ncbi:cell division protein ZapA [Marinobacterium jannaschii]|uniref:cell division protein ZapA n=1 Tax=Marinobacterium jannaschii TaxID=64970 RepID=UPI0004810C37|nr:cell division protein ZapA [Marinobacterium jannaschii]
MSQPEQRTVEVRLLDKEYTVSCPDGAEAELLASADYLDEKMREIRRHGKLVGLERIAVMAALNISHELISMRRQDRNDVEDRLRKLGAKIDRALQSGGKAQKDTEGSD